MRQLAQFRWLMDARCDSAEVGAPLTLLETGLPPFVASVPKPTPLAMIGTGTRGSSTFSDAQLRPVGQVAERNKRIRGTKLDHNNMNVSTSRGGKGAAISAAGADGKRGKSGSTKYQSRHK